MKGDLAKATRVVAMIQNVQKAYESQGLKTCVVIAVGPDKKPELEEWVRKNNITLPLGFLPDGQLPRAYRINPEADNTVMVHKRNTVTARFVNLTEKDEQKLVDAVAEILAK